MNIKNLDFTALDNWLEGQMAIYKTPGMAISVTDNKGTLHLGTYGYADLETRQAVTPQPFLKSVLSARPSLPSLPYRHPKPGCSTCMCR